MAKETMPKRILIIEDDKITQELYRDMFAGEKKYFIEVMDDAKAALDVLKENTFHLIVLDIIMEPMAGDSFLVYLRKEPKIKNIPVLVVSVLGPEILKTLKKIEKVTILQKPITKEALFKEIETALK